MHSPSIRVRTISDDFTVQVRQMVGELGLCGYYCYSIHRHMAARSIFTVLWLLWYFTIGVNRAQKEATKYIAQIFNLVMFIWAHWLLISKAVYGLWEPNTGTFNLQEHTEVSIFIYVNLPYYYIFSQRCKTIAIRFKTQYRQWKIDKMIKRIEDVILKQRIINVSQFITESALRYQVYLQQNHPILHKSSQMEIKTNTIYQQIYESEVDQQPKIDCFEGSPTILKAKAEKYIGNRKRVNKCSLCKLSLKKRLGLQWHIQNGNSLVRQVIKRLLKGNKANRQNKPTYTRIIAETAVRTPCGHSYHTTCILAVLVKWHNCIRCKQWLA